MQTARKQLLLWLVSLVFAPCLGSAATYVKIDLSQQKAYLYKNGRLITTSPVSTGKKGHRTRTGSYKVTQKSKWHRSSYYGSYVSKSSGKVVRSGIDSRKHRRPSGTYYRGTPMYYFLRFNGPIGMHAGHLPGYPASHGCVRLPQSKAQVFYNYCSVGTRVSVVP